MKKRIDISEVFPKYVFWDMDSSKLSIKRDKDIIIPRALYATNEDSFSKDIQVLEKYYSKNEIVDILKHTKEHISIGWRMKIRKLYRYLNIEYPL